MPVKIILLLPFILKDTVEMLMHLIFRNISSEMNNVEHFSVMFCWSTEGSFCLGRGRQKSLDYAS